MWDGESGGALEGDEGFGDAEAGEGVGAPAALDFGDEAAREAGGGGDFLLREFEGLATLAQLLASRGVDVGV